MGPTPWGSPRRGWAEEGLPGPPAVLKSSQSPEKTRPLPCRFGASGALEASDWDVEWFLGLDPAQEVRGLRA